MPGSVSFGRPAGRGFGLIELVITVAIVAILAALALPSYRQTIQNNRLTTTSDDFLTGLDTARNEAVTRSRFVALCPSRDGATCSGSDWSIGWIAYLDGYTHVTAPDAADVVRSGGAVDPTDTMTTSARAPSYLRFDRYGRPSVSSGALTSDLAFTWKPRSCASGEPLSRTLTLTPNGSTRVEKGGC